MQQLSKEEKEKERSQLRRELVVHGCIVHVLEHFYVRREDRANENSGSGARTNVRGAETDPCHGFRGRDAFVGSRAGNRCRIVVESSSNRPRKREYRYTREPVVATHAVAPYRFEAVGSLGLTNARIKRFSSAGRTTYLHTYVYVRGTFDLATEKKRKRR